MTRVLVISAQPRLRAQLRETLEIGGFDVVGDREALVDWAANESADVIVIPQDELPRGDRIPEGLDVRGLVVLSEGAHEQAVARVSTIPARAWAVVSRDGAIGELHAAVHAVALGLSLMPARVAERLLLRRIDHHRSNPVEPLDEHLTPREREVLDLVALGLSNRRIAERLQISEHTVKFHVATLFGKLGASNRTEAVRRAVRRGLTTL